jgi:hypothetical protein
MSRARPFARWRRRYGADPLHLLGHLAVLALAAFALDQIFSGGGVKHLLAWYVGFAIAHDLVFVPMYTELDRLVRRLLERLPSHPFGDIRLINHLRAPALISGVLLLVYAPLITGHSDAELIAVTGHAFHGYLLNWLLVTAVLFIGSGVVYTVRVARARASQRRGP